MSLFGHHTAAAGLVRYNGIQVQSSIIGAAITIGWGRGRTKCNLIWYGDFKSTPQTSGGGKGGGSQVTGYNYTSSFIAGVCEGPIRGIRSVYKDSSVFTASDDTTALSQAGLGCILGNAGQAPWSYMTTAHPSQALGYSSTAYVYGLNYALGTSPNLPNFTFEVDFGTQYSGAANGDANPKDIVTDYLTNVQYGLPGWSSGFNGDWTNYSNYCLASGLLLSPVEDTQRAARDFLNEILQATNSDAVWSEGVLKIRPYGDATVTGNGITWVPDLSPEYDLTEDDFVPVNGVPVSQEIVDQSQAYNFVQIEFYDRANQYNSGIAQAQDYADIDRYGRRTAGGATSIHSICDAQVARNVAQLVLQRSLYIRDIYTFKLPPSIYDRLEPLDLVTLTTTTDGLKLNRKLVQITEISDDETGERTCKAEGLNVGTASAALYNAHSGSGYSPNRDVAPGSVTNPVLFNPPTSLVAAGQEIWLAAGSTSATWGGCEVWISLDGTNYQYVGSITGPARYGVLTAALPSHADPDTTNTLSVDLTSSSGMLSPASATEANGGATLSLVGSELVTYQGATLTSAYHYGLTTLHRGFEGTAPASHSIGDSIVRLDDAIFKFSYLGLNVGSTIYVKLPSFNIYGRALEDISTVTAHTVALNVATALPDQVTNLRLTNGGTTWTGTQINVVCDPAARATAYRFDFYDSTGTTLLRSITTSTPSATYTSAMAALDGPQRTYVIDCVSQNAAGSASPSTTITVTNAAPAVVSSPAIAGGTTTGTATCTASSDPDVVGYVCFYSSTSGFNPATTGGVVYSGINSINIFGLAAGTYYGRIAAYDGWTSNPSLLNLSAEQTFTISTGGGSTPSGGGGGGGGYSGSGRINSF